MMAETDGRDAIKEGADEHLGFFPQQSIKFKFKPRISPAPTIDRAKTEER